MKDVIALAQERANLLGVEMAPGLLAYAVAEVSQAVLNYCHLTQLPQDLHYIVAKMAVSIATPADVKVGSAKSIRVGDTQVTLSPDTIDLLTSAIIDDYKGQLNAYRVVKWP